MQYLSKWFNVYYTLLIKGWYRMGFVEYVGLLCVIAFIGWWLMRSGVKRL